MDSLADKTESKDIWGDLESSIPQNLTLHFDTVNHEIGVFSDDVDAKGRPMLQWELNAETGHVKETKRAQDGSEVETHHRDIDPLTLNREQNAKNLEKELQDTQDWIQSKADLGSIVAKDATTASPLPIEDEWNDLEKQRDIAFKIMYFFIVFIIATFSLLYAFFRMTQKQEQEAAVRKGAKGRQTSHQESFMDFLAGHTDNENYTVNPYARHAAQPTRVTSQFTSASAPFANLADKAFTTIADHGARKAQKQAMVRQQAHAFAGQLEGHRQSDMGFGSGNLEHLGNEERGRFDDISVDCGKKPDFTKLASFNQ